MVYGTVHAIADVSGFTVVYLVGAPKNFAYGVIFVSVFTGFVAAQAATLLAGELRSRRLGHGALPLED